MTAAAASARLMRTTISVCVALLMVWAILYAAPSGASPVPLSGDARVVDLNANASYLADHSGEMSLENARALADDGAFAPYSIDLIRFDDTRATHWLYVDLTNSSAGRLDVVLDLNVRLTPLAEIFVVRSDRVEQVLRQDLTTSFHERPLVAPAVVAPLTLAASETARVFVRFRAKTDLDVSISVLSEEAFRRASVEESRKQFFFFGFLACVAIGSIAVSIALREPSAAFYAAYVSVFAIYMFHADGLAFQFLWPSSPLWNTVAQRPIHFLVALSGALFARSFFKLSERSPTLDKVFLGVAAVSALGLITPLVSDHRIFSLIAFIFLILGAQLYWITGVIAVRKGWPGGAFFLFGALSVAAAGVFAALAHIFPDLATLSATRDWGRLAFATEAFAFLLAIGSKITAIRRERERSDARAIDALAQKLALSKELRSAEDAFHKAAQVAEKRREEIAHATHDLRQPVTSMRIALSRLDSVSVEDRAALEQHCAYFETLIARYLDNAADADRPIAEPSAATEPQEVLSADLLLKAVHAMFENEASQKGIDIRTTPTSLRIRSDAMAVMRILSNLVANAVKYTDRGGVLIGARPSGPNVKFVVYDTGPGLTEAEQTVLRRSSVRGESSTGKGLGLSVCEDLAKAHDLALFLHSTPGKGSCFGFLAERHLPADP